MQPVDGGGGSVCLAAWVLRIVHGVQEQRQHVRMRLFLQSRAEIGAHLAQAVDGGPADARVRVRGEGVQARLNSADDILLHALRATFSDLRERDEGGVTFLPVGVTDEGRHGGRAHR